MAKILTEYYRPTKIEDVVGLGKLNFKIDQNMPHLLLYGIQGSGKTTLARIIIKTLCPDGRNVLTLNASKERGIDVIRSQVTSFASSKGIDDGIRIVFLDEADGLTNDAQDSLRNAMEKYVDNCRFILSCNFINKIIEPLRSRCVQVEFGNIIKIDDIVKRLEYICKEEKIPYEAEALRRIAVSCGSDIRSAVNKLQELQDGVTVDKLKNESKLALEVSELLRMDEFEDARQLYLNNKPNDEQFLRDLYEVFMVENDNIGVKRGIIKAIAKCYRHLPYAAWKQIQVEDCLLSIEEILLKG